MSLLLQIQSQIDEADRRIVEIKSALAEHPGLPSIQANLDSVVRWRRSLEAQLSDAGRKPLGDTSGKRVVEMPDECQPIRGTG